MRFTPRHTELIKFLAVGTVVFFAGSALTTHVVSKLLIDLDSIGVSDTTAGSEDETLADQDSDQDPPSPAGLSGKAKPNHPEMAGKATYKQASADAIVASNPFCPSCVPVSEAAPLLANGSGLPVTTGDTRCSLPLQLLATMESDDPLWSMATIRDMDNNSLAPYTANEQIRPGVTLLAVERGRVVLLNQGRREYVDIGTEPPPPPKPTTTAKPDEGKPSSKIAIEGADEAIDCTDENNCTVDKAFVEQLLAKPQQLMSQARMAPVAKDGETAGFRVSGIKTGSLAKMIGLKNGDVVSEINGQRLGNIDDALAMYQKLRSAKHLSVTVERGGALIHKEISIK